MSVPDAMTIHERYKYLRRMMEPYRQASRTERSRMLDHMVTATGLHRRSLVRRLQPSALERKPRSRQRGMVYGAAIDDVIRVVWESLDYVCATRLTPTLLSTARHLATFGEVRLTPEVEVLLGQISRPTVQRRLTRLGQDRPRLPRRGPERANAVRKGVPMGRIPWDMPQPGHCEVDLVHHCGPSAEGTYVHTVQVVDVATGWAERAAVLGRNQEAMEGGFQRIGDRLPFALVELHPDNDSAFFNNHLMHYFGRTVGGTAVDAQ